MKRYRWMLWLTLLLLCCATPLAAAPASDYVVQPGDSLTRIATRHGVSVDALASANGLSRTAWLYTGQRLTIPGTTSAGSVYVVQPGDTLITIAIRQGVTLRQLAEANGLRWNAWVYTGQRLTIPGGTASPTPTGPAPADGVHVVQAGENLFRIGLRYGTSAAAIRATNNLRSDVIYVGQRLTIPGADASGTRPPVGAPPVDVPVAEGEKWIGVNLTAQTITAYQGETPIYTTLTSTGLPRTPTVVGTYSIYVKYASAPMSGPGYYLPNVPHIMYFYRGYGIHGAYWHNNFGTPMSRGCVNLSLPDAEWFYNWAPVGTKVVTHY